MTNHNWVSLGWLLSHGPISLCVDLFVFICVYFVYICFILHICCIIVSVVEWIWWDWSLILRTYLPSVLWHCWLGHVTRKKPVPDMTYNVFGGTLNLAQSINLTKLIICCTSQSMGCLLCEQWLGIFCLSFICCEYPAAAAAVFSICLSKSDVLCCAASWQNKVISW